MSKFQMAAQAVVDGDIPTLENLLREDPALASARSPKNGATLLHYVGANGPVEDEMQKTPANAVEIAKVIISIGANVDAIIENDTASTPLVSLVTSEAPAIAGLQKKLTKLFLNHGAAVNGLNNDGYPLACALLFGYRDAIEALLEGGARIDNIVAAAGLGRMDYLRECLDDAGKLTPASKPYPDPFRRDFDENQVIKIALEHAQQHKQDDAAQFLSKMSAN